MIQQSILRERKRVFTTAVVWEPEGSGQCNSAWLLAWIILELPQGYVFCPHCAALYLIADNCTVLRFYAIFLFNKVPHKSRFLLVSTPSTRIILFPTLTMALFYAEWYSYPQQTGSFSGFRNVKQMNKTNKQKSPPQNKVPKVISGTTNIDTGVLRLST